jgi:hypothetical protein
MVVLSQRVGSSIPFLNVTAIAAIGGFLISVTKKYNDLKEDHSSSLVNTKVIYSVPNR